MNYINFAARLCGRMLTVTHPARRVKAAPTKVKSARTAAAVAAATTPTALTPT